MTEREYLTWRNRLEPVALQLAGNRGDAYDFEDLISVGMVAIVEAPPNLVDGGLYIRAKSRMIDFCRQNPRTNIDIDYDRLGMAHDHFGQALD